jgi:hypothetical protein
MTDPSSNLRVVRSEALFQSNTLQVENSTGVYLDIFLIVSEPLASPTATKPRRS